MAEKEIIRIVIRIVQELISKIPPEILEATKKKLATAIDKVLEEASVKLPSAIIRKLPNLIKAGKDLRFSIPRNYIINYKERHGTLKILGMSEPVSLDSV